MSKTIHDLVKIIKDAQELDTSGGGGDDIVPKHGETHAKSASDPIPQELDGVPVDLSGLADGQVPTYDAGAGKFVPGDPGGSLTPEFDFVDFEDGLADPSHQEGRVFWDDTEKTLAFYNDKTPVKMAIGRETWIRVCNRTGSPILNGTVVYLSGVTVAGCIEVSPAIATDYDKDKVLAVVTMDLGDGQEGEATRFGTVKDIDLSSFMVGDFLYLSPTVLGGLTNVRPTFPARPVILGRVLENTVSGKMLVVVEPDQYDFEFDGTVIERQDVFVVVDGGVVYAEAELLGGGDLPVQLEGDIHLLDCTTGAGVGGRARVALTPGTDAAPQINYVFVRCVGGVPTLMSSATRPTGAYAHVSTVVLWSAAKTAVDGPARHQRVTDAKAHDGRGRIAHIGAKLRKFGATWEEGVTPTATITARGAAVDDLDVEVSSGTVWQLHPQDFPTLDSAVDGIWVANASGLGTLTPYQKITNLNQCLEYSDGTPVSGGDRFNLVIWGAVNKTSGECKLFVNLSTKGYFTDDAGYYDSSGAAVTGVNKSLFPVAFLICRIPVKYTLPGNGTLEFINPAGLPEIVSLLGTPLNASATGGSSGGGGVAGLNDLTDVSISSPQELDILVYDSVLAQWGNLDPTELITRADVRQTVLSGPKDSNGMPDFIVAQDSNTELWLQGATAGAVVMTFADGYDRVGVKDFFHYEETDVKLADITAESLANGTYYLVATRNPSTGVVTYGWTMSKPVYTKNNSFFADETAVPHMITNGPQDGWVVGGLDSADAAITTAYEAFDGNYLGANDLWFACNTFLTTNGYLEFYHTSAKAIGGIRIYTAADVDLDPAESHPYSVEVQAYNGTSWVTLKTYIGIDMQGGTSYLLKLDSAVAYEKYRIYFAADSGKSYIRLKEIHAYECPEYVFNQQTMEMFKLVSGAYTQVNALVLARGIVNGGVWVNVDNTTGVLENIYAIRGEFQSGWEYVVAGDSYSYSHNIGPVPEELDIKIADPEDNFEGAFNNHFLYELYTEAGIGTYMSGEYVNVEVGDDYVFTSKDKLLTKALVKMTIKRGW